MHESCIYCGTIAHKRLKPRPHALSYDVFWTFLDLDRIDELSSRVRLFSHNRFNAVAFYDRDHGTGDGDLAAHARSSFASAGLADATDRVFLLSYPRVAGYVFNPISVYFGYDSGGRLAGAIYEVNNTFGERHSYVVGVRGATDAGPASRPIHAHGCEKRLYVSPFTEMEGRYSFRLGEPSSEFVLGVMLRDGGGPVLKTHLRASAIPFTDASLARLLLTPPGMTLKVTAGIHYEAAKLWFKGVPLTARPKGHSYSASKIHPAAAGVEQWSTTPKPDPIEVH